MEYSGEGFRLCGKAFNLRSGEIQYFRIYPTDWHRHFKLAKDFGLNTIQTYVPWNLHEPEKGKFNFEGILDLCAFLDMAKEYGLKVLLRPSPFICAECEFAGLPVWLHFDKEVEIRVGIENEYGGNGYDRKYLQALYDMLVDLGIDVPCYTTDNSIPALHMMHWSKRIVRMWCPKPWRN